MGQTTSGVTQLLLAVPTAITKPLPIMRSWGCDMSDNTIFFIILWPPLFSLGFLLCSLSLPPTPRHLVDTECFLSPCHYKLFSLVFSSVTDLSFSSLFKSDELPSSPLPSPLFVTPALCVAYFLRVLFFSFSHLLLISTLFFLPQERCKRIVLRIVPATRQF